MPALFSPSGVVNSQLPRCFAYSQHPAHPPHRIPAARVLPGSVPVAGGPCCSGGGPTDTWPACRMPAGGYEDALFELKTPSSLHGLAEKILLARRNCSPVRPRPTHLPACPLPAAYVDLCVFVCCRLLARTELRARRHVEHGRIPAPSRTSSTALGFAAARGVQSPNRVFAPSSCVCCCPHAHPLQA